MWRKNDVCRRLASEGKALPRVRLERSEDRLDGQFGVRADRLLGGLELLGGELASLLGRGEQGGDGPLLRLDPGGAAAILGLSDDAGALVAATAAVLRSGRSDRKQLRGLGGGNPDPGPGELVHKKGLHQGGGGSLCRGGGCGVRVLLAQMLIV